MTTRADARVVVELEYIATSWRAPIRYSNGSESRFWVRLYEEQADGELRTRYTGKDFETFERAREYAEGLYDAARLYTRDAFMVINPMEEVEPWHGDVPKYEALRQKLYENGIAAAHRKA